MTIEASVYIPVIIILLFYVLYIGIGFYQNSKTEGADPVIGELDIVQEFYNYQVIGEVGEEIFGDKS